VKPIDERGMILQRPEIHHVFAVAGSSLASTFGSLDPEIIDFVLYIVRVVVGALIGFYVARLLRKWHGK